MDLKEIQQKLKQLRDRIRDEGRISHDAEVELKDILNATLVSANDELASIQNKLNVTMNMRAGNDNIELTQEQKKRLSIIEKSGTGSSSVH